MRNWFDKRQAESGSFHLLLHGNVFRCTCETIDFIQWISAIKVKFTTIAIGMTHTTKERSNPIPTCNQISLLQDLNNLWKSFKTLVVVITDPLLNAQMLFPIL
jgi:hypothetical protein